MLANAKVFFLNILIAVYFTKSIFADCLIHLPEDPSLRPTYYKFVGSHKLKMGVYDPILVLHEEQKIEAYCDINFEQPFQYQAFNKLYIRCSKNYIYTSSDDSSSHGNIDYFGDPTLECSQSKWNLYESLNNFIWCPANVTSYILARPKYFDGAMTESNYEYLAYVCYDIYRFSLYSVYFTLAPKATAYEQPPIFYNPSVQIKYVKETFGSNRISENTYSNQEFKNWISSNYNFHLIIQHLRLHFIFGDQFSSLIEIAWWENLRAYNWQHYINALERHVENENKIYDILAGVSGTLKAPIARTCPLKYTMEEVVFNKTHHMPLYVWNYIQDKSNRTNEVVIIGFNSPFNEFYSPDEITFCPDKCQEIPWLKQTSAFFHYSIMGIVFCCDVEDVIHSKRLEGFPENGILPKLADLTTSAYESTELTDYD